MAIADLMQMIKSTGASRSVAERSWVKAKLVVTKHYGFAESDPRFWPLVTAVAMKLMKAK